MVEHSTDIHHETYMDSPYNTRITITVTGDVANFTGPIVDRSVIRQDLWSDYRTYCSYDLVNEFVQEIFDRWGRLKPEYRTHPIAKGTGIWGSELGQGNILILDEMRVLEDISQRQEIGIRVFELLWACAMANYSCEFCFAKVNHYWGSDGPSSFA